MNIHVTEKTYVTCRNKEEYLWVVDIAAEAGYIWNSGHYPNEKNYWNGNEMAIAFMPGNKLLQRQTIVDGFYSVEQFAAAFVDTEDVLDLQPVNLLYGLSGGNDYEDE